MANSGEYILKQLEAGDRVTGLSLGDAAFTPLKTFFQKSAKDFDKASLARTWIVKLATGKPVAYITALCGEIAVQDADLAPPDEGDDDAELDYRYDHYPAIKIARLAVDSRHQRCGLGHTLVETVVGLAVETVSPLVGCRFVVVDAKRQSVDFYDSCGFSIVDSPVNLARPEPVMFIDLKKLTARRAKSS